ncbi:MAG: DUF3822 family protein [Chitinophagaceae bacterium]|nr:DUF3822 family protein [Chitinophagaceae bacterium]
MTLKPAFELSVEIIPPDVIRASTLLLELNERQLTAAWVNRSTQELLALQQYHLHPEDQSSMVDLLRELVSNDAALSGDVSETIIIYNYSESSLVPAESYSIELSKNIAELTTGNTQKGLVLSEKISGTEICNVYRIPREIHTLLQQRFSAGKYWHFYSLVLTTRMRTPKVASEQFEVTFYPDKFVVAVFEDQQLLLIQSYHYQVPEDVAFQLLNICKLLNVDPNRVLVQLSGLIDADSALYSVIARYFLLLDWETDGAAAWKNEQLADFPPHYFSPLLKLALCV